MNPYIEQIETVRANREFFRGDDESLGVGQDVQTGDESWPIEGSTCRSSFEWVQSQVNISLFPLPIFTE
jgi:hypothetical protein